MSGRGRADRGLTLLELVVATALFALVATMAAQALSTGLIQQRGIDRTQAQAAALARTLALLRQDLEALVPVAARPGGAAGDAPLARTGGGLALSRLGPDGRLVRVVWRLDPGGAGLGRIAVPLGAEVPPGVTEVLLPGATGLTLVRHGETDEDGLPEGMEVRIDRREGGGLRVVVAR
jgi:prepilin-type N-terminal cleavage/methylation domain-containing protein